jgi:hypothetical protein
MMVTAPCTSTWLNEPCHFAIWLQQHAASRMATEPVCTTLPLADCCCCCCNSSLTCTLLSESVALKSDCSSVPSGRCRRTLQAHTQARCGIPLKTMVKA